MVRQDLQSSTYDGAFFSLMVGLGETYLAAYALALGSGEVTAGWMATVPMLAGALLQLLSPWAVQRVRSLRRWVVACAFVQAASLAIVPSVGWPATPPIGLLFLIAAVYWTAGLASGPVWNTWMESAIPRTLRARYFAVRSRVCQACLLVGFATAGIVLDVAADQNWLLTAFAGLFLSAALCRLISMCFLMRQSEATDHELPRQASLREVIGNLPGHAGGRLLAYLFVVQITVQMAGPFFTPYLLAELQVPYLEFMLLIGAGFAGKMWAFPLWGRMAQRMGPQRLLRIGGLAIIPLSALWLFSTSFWYLLCVQILAGIAWSAYELAMLLLFFETIPRRERTSLLTIYNAGNATSLVLGSLLGGAILHWLDVESASAVATTSWSPYLLLFGASTAMRLLTIPLLVRVPDLRFRVTTPAVRVLAVRPADAATDPPVLPSIANGNHVQFESS